MARGHGGIAGVELLRAPSDGLVVSMRKDVVPSEEVFLHILAAVMRRYRLPMPSGYVKDREKHVRYLAYFPKRTEKWWDRYRGSWGVFPV